MVKKNLEATQQLKRIAALPYNPNAKDDIKVIRERYGLDKLNTEQAFEWYENQIKRNQSRGLIKSAYAYLFPDRFPDRASEIQQVMEGPFDTQIPVEKDIGDFMARYQIPLRAFLDVLNYVCRGNLEDVWRHWHSPSVEYVQELQDAVFNLKITIRNITAWTTKKEWEEIWNKDILPLRETSRELLGVEGPLPKRATLESMDRKMKRSSQWYQLSLNGLTIREVLDQWSEKYKEQVPEKGIDESTVTKDINEFQQIITPISVKT